MRRLRLLHNLARYGTVSATAEALRLTAPAVSQQLTALEREAGTRLLERDGRKLRLTEAGRVLVAHAEVMLDQMAAAEADLVALRAEVSGTVRIAAFPSAMAALLPPAWTRLTARHGTRLRLRLTEMDPSDGLTALRRGEVELTVAHAYDFLPAALPPGCERHELATDPVVVALPVATGPHEGADAVEPVDLATLADHAWISAPHRTTCFEMSQRACGNAGFVPRIIAECGDFPAVLAMVAAGIGVSLIPRMAVRHIPPGVMLHPLAVHVTRSVFAATRRSGTQYPAVRVVLDELLATPAATPQPS
ncbi:LysR family transcriptional regulator [Kitasatospora sp. NPDC017646]|uniref:LysR family transcriptional regulator n=1 Tax=Kitasatospora sp. NPDC017646 TaxID=3364024 RepID=UPI0037A7784F